MKIELSVEQRMIEYGESKSEPGNDDFVQNRSAWAPILDMQYNAGARATGFAYEMLDGVPCIPDGGLWQVCAHKSSADAADKSRRLAEVSDALRTIPQEHKVTLGVTYVEYGPRSIESAAREMGVSTDQCYDKLERALEWMEYKLCIQKRKVA